MMIKACASTLQSIDLSSFPCRVILKILKAILADLPFDT